MIIEQMKSIYKKYISEKNRIKIRLFFNKVTSVCYIGNTYHCNCCGKSFRRFKSKGKIRRKNAECPYCGSLERVRNLLFYIENETNLLRDKVKLLHFAPEWCLIPVFKSQKNLDYINADINPALADYKVDITSIPYKDEWFDYVICSHVLSVIPDEKKAIKELYRVLAVGGTALILTFIGNNLHTIERGKIDTVENNLRFSLDTDLLRLHGKDFGECLKKVGFQVEMIDYISVLGEEERKKYLLGDGKSELIFKCTKL